MFKLLPFVIIIAGCSENGLRLNENNEGLGGEDTDGTPPVVVDTSADPETGGVKGRICDPDDSSWLAGANVWIDVGDGDLVEATTDANGYFVLDGLPPGVYTVFVQSDSFSTEFEVTIEAGELLELAEEECFTEEEEVGSVKGRICAPNADSWIVGAEVWVDEDGVEVSTTTDADGYFVLEGLPPGTYTVHVQKGSFSTEFQVTIEANELLVLDEEECLEDEDVRIAVVYGDYDSIEVVLSDLGFGYDGYYSSDVDSLLYYPDSMAEYDIIFLNCGISDSYWTPYQTTIANNIKDYVQNGGSIYASDWSYYFTEAAYPNMVNFYGNDTIIGKARVGNPGELSAHVLDGAMVATLGSEYADLNYDLPGWVVPLSVGTGSALITGTAPYSTFDDETFEYIYGDASAVLAARQYDGDGQVLYTSFHNESQTTWHMDLLLQEIIYSL